MLLSPLYHWSPADRYEAIRSAGLRAHSEPCVASTSLPYVCAGPDPTSAWMISGAMEWVSDVDYWDLWLINIAGTDEIRVRSEFGPQIVEVKLYTDIPPDRLWWVGRRDVSGSPLK